MWFHKVEQFKDPQQTEQTQDTEILETIEKEIETLEARKTELNTLLVSGTTDHIVLTQWADEIADLDKLISRKSDRWLELSEI